MSQLAIAPPPEPATRTRWLRFAAPQLFYPLAGACLPWLWALAALLSLAGLVVGLGVAPTDFQQGDAYRIIFIHVPAAWMSMLIYLALAFWVARPHYVGTPLVALYKA